MNIFRRVISASLSPNCEPDDIVTAGSVFLQPWMWRYGRHTAQSEAWFNGQFEGYTARSFNSGRSALLAILQSFGIGKGDEVLVQSFTCVAVPNSVRWSQATPVYVDIDRSLNLDYTDAEKKVSKKTKAIIVQHTLGLPADMKHIVSFARKHNLMVIEDCAHALGTSSGGFQAGRIGDASFFSFGRDKIVSSVFGGMALIHERHADAVARLAAIHAKLPPPRLFWLLQQIIHPIMFGLILPFYTIGAGKVLLIILQKLSLLSFPVYPEEKKGLKPSDFPATYANGLAALLLNQLPKLERYTQNRRDTAKLYARELGKNPDVTLLTYPPDSVYLRFPVLVHAPGDYMAKAKKQGILLGNWYHNVIDPAGTDFKAAGYIPGSCPAAEETARHIINLPTRITRTEAMRIISLFQDGSTV